VGVLPERIGRGVIRTVSNADRVQGTPTPPGDKSISHRAVLLNSLTSGSAHVSNFCEGDDRTAMLGCLRGLGISIKRIQHTDGRTCSDCFYVRGRGPNGLREPDHVLNAGNSGTTMRLVTGLLAAQPFFSVISGDKSLRARPMDRVVRPLAKMGARLMGRGQDALAPLAIRGGGLKGIEYHMPVASAQLKSALLIAGLYADGTTTVVEPAPSRDHTERMLKAMGADVKTDGPAISVDRSDLFSMDVWVPGDISNSAFWMVLAACHPNASLRISRVGINPTRTGIIDVLKEMGVKMRLENIHEDAGEPSADLIVESSQLKGIEIGGDIIPRVIDEIPILALAATFAEGRTVIRDAHELRLKESDRIAATAEGLNRMGASIEERTDGLVIEGGSKLTGTQVDGHGDHRIAMTMGIAGTLASGQTTVTGAEAASISYPRFWDELGVVTGNPVPVSAGTESADR
jgi:3-phosphoshikimate 1-carboxyvinyltransferase